MHPQLSLKRQTGAAIIVALFVTALVAAAAAAMILRLQSDIQRITLSDNAAQAHFAVQGAVAWAKDQLMNNLKQQKPNQIVDKTPIHSPVDTVNGMKIVSTIYDAQSYFNLNNLTDEKNQAAFLQLIKATNPALEEKSGRDIVLGITDWITPAKKNQTFNEYYAKQQPPYQAPHQNMVSISELRLVKGMTPVIFAKLEANVLALPAATLINVNNAPAAVLMTLSPSLTLTSAQAIIAARQQTPFTKVDDFFNLPAVKNNNIPQDKISAVSDYFLLQTNVTVGQQQFIYYSLLKRSAKDAKDSKQQPSVVVLWQMQGTL